MSGQFGEMIWQNMTAIGEEKKETCIHCGREWYSIHYRDEVCHQCQQLGKPGREILATRQLLRQKAMIAVAGLIVILFLASFLN